LRGVGADGNGDIDVEGADHSADDSVRSILRRVAYSKAPLQLAAHCVEQLALYFR
jgi:hypothetical protein